MYISEIKQLYPKLYEEILQNSHTPEYVLNGVCNNVNDAMIWSNTPQGSAFWRLVHQGNIEEAQRMYPELFVQLEKDDVQEIQNGLFKSTI